MITSVTVTGTGVSSPIVLNHRSPVFKAGIGCIISATATYTVEHTFADPFSPTFDPSLVDWFPHETIVAATANTDGNYAFPARAVRLNVAASTGSVTMNIIQPAGM